MADEAVWLSQAAYERLQAEREHLVTEGRTNASAAIEEARQHGDLRENAEYHSAKEEQGKLEARIRELDTILRSARVGDATDSGVVSAGMVVTVVDADDDRDTFLLGSREDRVEGLTVVSAQSPLGRALVGARIGDTVTYEAPAGEFKVTVAEAKPLAH